MFGSLFSLADFGTSTTGAGGPEPLPEDPNTRRYDDAWFPDRADDAFAPQPYEDAWYPERNDAAFAPQPYNDAWFG